jgi:hypothetical protein
LLASADPAHWQTARTFGQDSAVSSLRYVLADAGYDSNASGEAIEHDASGRRTGKRFLCPQIYRRGEHRPPKTPLMEKGARKRQRQRRKVVKHSSTGHGPGLYTVDAAKPSSRSMRLKTRFDLHDRAWHRGLDNNRIQFLAAILSYQILLRYNRTRGHHDGQLQWILDTL